MGGWCNVLIRHISDYVYVVNIVLLFQKKTKLFTWLMKMNITIYMIKGLSGFPSSPVGTGITRSPQAFKWLIYISCYRHIIVPWCLLHCRVSPSDINRVSPSLSWTRRAPFSEPIPNSSLTLLSFLSLCVPSCSSMCHFACTGGERYTTGQSCISVLATQLLANWFVNIAQSWW